MNWLKIIYKILEYVMELLRNIGGMGGSIQDWNVATW